jgi:hypothetical protein
MDIIADFIPLGRNNRPAHPMLPIYITIHETGNRSIGADAKMHARYLKGDSAAANSVSWHFTVDDHSVYQHLPVIESAYHAGDGGQGIGNRQSIGIEICVNADGNIEQAKENAQWLVGKLMVDRGILIGNVVQHNHWSGKNCPQTMRETNTWTAFKNGIQKVEANTMTDQTKTWQRYLTTRGYPLNADGDFGQKSLDASMALVKKLDDLVTARNVEIATLKKSIATLTSEKQTLNVNLTAAKVNLSTANAKITAAKLALN